MRDFPDVYSDDLLDLRPERDIEFIIDLCQEQILSLRHLIDQMAPIDLKELKV